MTLLWLFLGMVVVWLIVRGAIVLKVVSLRRAGIHPARGKATMADVARLRRLGYRVLAIRCYREIHPLAGLTEAKQAVEEMGVGA